MDNTTENTENQTPAPPMQPVPPESPTTDPMISTAAPVQPTPPPESHNTETKQSNKMLVIIVIVVVLVLAVLAAIFMMKKPVQAPATVETTPQATQKAEASDSAKMQIAFDQLTKGTDDASLEKDLNTLKRDQDTVAAAQKELDEDQTQAETPENL